MNSEVRLNNEVLNVDFELPIDISIPLRSSKDNVEAWHSETPRFEAVISNDFIGDVNKGGSVNFKNVFFSPHGNGTHTECVGHISKENFTINQCLKEFMFKAQLISIEPEEINGDKIITLESVQDIFTAKKQAALIIRSLPNREKKLNRNYSNTNPPYIAVEAIAFMNEKGIKHLLIDSPSVDKEQDEGKVAAHHLFWQYPHNTQTDKTITELIFVPNSVKDGFFLLNIQIASFEMDASPSKPILYEIKDV